MFLIHRTQIAHIFIKDLLMLFTLCILFLPSIIQHNFLGQVFFFFFFKQLWKILNFWLYKCKPHFIYFFFEQVFYFILFLLYNIVLVLPYINMNLPQVYTCSQSWTPLPPPSPYHPSGSSQCTSPKLPVSRNEPGLAIRFPYDTIHVSVPFSQIISPLPLPQSPKDCSIICVSPAVSHTGLSLSSF